MLQQLGLNRDLPIFGHSMAGPTEGYKVRQVVGFLVSLYTEFAERSNVVNIKFAAKLLFGQSAILALVAVALACLAPLFFPVLAVVASYATLPLWVIFTYEGSGHPLRHVFFAAKVVWCSLCNAAIHFKWGAALRTGYGDLIDLPLVFAIVVAKIVFSYRELIRRTGEDFSAMIARHFDSPIKILLAARVGTIVRLVLGEGVLVDRHELPASIARYFNLAFVPAWLSLFCLAHARVAAIVVLILGEIALRSRYFLATCHTGDRFRSYLCGMATLAGTVDAVLVFTSAGRSQEILATSGTDYFCLGRNRGLGTRLRAVAVRSSHLARRSLDHFPTSRARYFDSIAGCHKKTSCQCLTGCLSRAYGHQQKALQSIADRLLPVNKCMPSTVQVYHDKGQFAMTKACSLGGRHG